MLIEFESFEPALAGYNSSDYRAAAKLRQAYAESEVLIGGRATNGDGDVTLTGIPAVPGRIGPARPRPPHGEIIPHFYRVGLGTGSGQYSRRRKEDDPKRSPWVFITDPWHEAQRRCS